MAGLLHNVVCETRRRPPRAMSFGSGARLTPQMTEFALGMILGVGIGLVLGLVVIPFVVDMSVRLFRRPRVR